MKYTPRREVFPNYNLYGIKFVYQLRYTETKVKQFKLCRNEAVVIDHTITVTVTAIKWSSIVCKIETQDERYTKTIRLRPSMGVDISPRLTIILDCVGWFSATLWVNVTAPYAVIPLAYARPDENGTMPYNIPDLMGTPRVGGDDLWWL